MSDHSSLQPPPELVSVQRQLLHNLEKRPWSAGHGHAMFVGRVV
jgi:hypothetical protein